MGRPIALTEEKRTRLLEAIRVMGTLKWAARFVGINASTLFRYLAAGRKERVEARERGDEELPPPGSAWELLVLVEEAGATHVAASLERIGIAAQSGDWKADAWILEHGAGRRDFGPSQRVEMGGARGASAIKVDAKVSGEVRGVVVLPPLADDDETEGGA